MVGLVPRRGLEVFLTFCVTTESMHSELRDGSDVVSSSSLELFRKRLPVLTTSTDESGAELLTYDGLSSSEPLGGRKRFVVRLCTESLSSSSSSCFVV
jgi:hypothetical protein